MLTPTFDHLPEFKLAGVRRFHDVSAAPTTIPPQWHELHKLRVPNVVAETVSYGATCAMDSAIQRLEYLAGFHVSSFDGLPAEMGRMVVPASRYAVFTLPNVMAIRPFWLEFFSTWLPESGEAVSRTPDFERYDERFDPVTRGPLEMWIPLQERADG